MQSIRSTLNVLGQETGCVDCGASTQQSDATVNALNWKDNPKYSYLKIIYHPLLLQLVISLSESGKNPSCLNIPSRF